MSIGCGIYFNGTFGTGGGSTPATFTLDPDPFDIGTALSDTADLTSDRLAGVRVSLDGAIAAVASIATPLSWDGGGCGDGVGEVLTLTLTRTGGTSGQSYAGELVVEDDTGEEHRFDVSLTVPSSLLDVATTQVWDYVWAMDTAGTSQPNQGTAGVNALALTQARATTAQMGALGRFPLTTDTADRASTGAQITMGAGLGAIVVCVNVTDTSSPRAIYSGGGNSNDNKAYILVDGGNFALYKGGGPAGVMNLAAASTGVWLFGLAFDALGGVTAWCKKVGGARQDFSGTRGLSSTLNPQILYLGGDGAVYFSTEGDYYFLAVRTGATMTSGEFDALAATLS